MPAAGAAWSAGAAAGAAAGAGGVAAVSVPAASCFAQAVSISAATIALRASLVFIDISPKEARVVLIGPRPGEAVPGSKSSHGDGKFYRSPGTIGKCCRAAATGRVATVADGRQANV